MTLFLEGAALADHRLVRRYVHGMAAAGEVVFNIFHSMLCDNREGLFCYVQPAGFIVVRQVGVFHHRLACIAVFAVGIGVIHILGNFQGVIAFITSSHMIMVVIDWG